MKNTFSILFAFSIVSLLFSCQPKQTKDKASDTAVDSGSSVTAEKSDFKEGEIQVSITTPGSKLGEMFQKVDPSKGKIQEQMKKIAQQLSPAERAEMEAEGQKNGMLNLAVVMLPLRSVIYVKDDQATAKFDALTYHGENYVNDRKKEGLMYLKSQNSAKEATISYTGDNLKKMASTDVSSTAYNITTSKETELIDGYLCTKSMYTRKDEPKKAESINAVPGTSGKIYKLEVWASKQMPVAVNFVHPLYVEEKAGIMKILIQYEKESKLKVLYQFTSVKNRTVTPAEMAIHKTPKIIDFGKAELEASMQLFGIVLGM